MRELTLHRSIAVNRAPSAAAATRGVHADLPLLSFLVSLYDLVILFGSAALGVALRPAVLAPEHRLGLGALMLAVYCGWGWMRSLWRHPLDYFVGQSVWQRVVLVGSGAALLYGVPAGLVILLSGRGDPLLSWLVLWGLMALGGAVGLRVGLDAVLARWRRQGVLQQVVAIVGGGDLAVRLVDWLRSNCADTVRIAGVFDDRGAHDPSRVRIGDLLSGNTDDLITLSRRLDIDRVIVALPHAAEQRLVGILRKLRQIPVDICLAPDQIGFATAHDRVGEFRGLPLTRVYGRPLESGQRLLKALLDRVIAGALFAALLPAGLVIALLVRLEGGPGPVLTRQQCAGLGGRAISVFGFRTSTSGPVPRQTRVGRVLTMAGLDELPRLLNVLRGDLSMVGPRPLAEAGEGPGLRDVVGEYASRHLIKPGLTGLTQLHQSEDDPPGERAPNVDYDLHYIDNWSIWRDIGIMLRVVARCIHPRLG